MVGNLRRILFINPCLRLGAHRKYPPVGLAFIIKAAKRSHYDFDLLDMDAEDLSIDQLDHEFVARGYDKYDIYAFGTIVTSLKLVSQLASLIRRYNEKATIIIGNSVATSIPELLLHSTEADIAVLGEGDITIVKLLDALNKSKPLEEVDGIAFLKDGSLVTTRPRTVIANLDMIGFPDWDVFKLEKYNTGMQKLTVDDSKTSIVYPLNAARGCPYKCTFCYHVFQGQRYRKYSEKNVIEEFSNLYYNYGATFIQFWDELTFPTINSVERMVNGLETLDFRIGWEGITRADLFSYENVELITRMKDVGCKSMAFSIENGSPEILKAMNKKLHLERVVENSMALHRGNVTPMTSIIFGYPQETPQTIQATLKLCEECDVFPSVGFLQPLPGTPIYNWAKANGYIDNEFDYLMESGDRQDFHINLTTIPTNEFVDMVVSGLKELAQKMGLEFENPLKTGVYQKSRRITTTRDMPKDTAAAE